jgi:predicted DNA-binding transcriptional regulator AlpA
MDFLALGLTDAEPTPDELLIGLKQLAALLGRSASALSRDVEAGRVPSAVLLGGSRKWRIDEIRAWVTAGCPDHATWVAMPAAKPWYPSAAVGSANNQLRPGTSDGTD